MRHSCILAGPFLLISGLASAQTVAATPAEPIFRRQQLSQEFYCEGTSHGDLDRDGNEDIVAGPRWYKGPEFEVAVELYTPKAFDPAGYSDHFFSWTADFDRDGWLDVLVVGFPGQQACWFQNPQNLGKPWQRHDVLDGVDNESPAWTDLDGDGHNELVFMHAGRLGYAGPDRAHPEAPWSFHAISPQFTEGPFVHGLGVGDVDGDGRADVMERSGWWQQPASLAGDPEWQRHATPFTNGHGGAQMFALDIDGDGDRDVLTSLNAHAFGLSWFEQQPPAAAGAEPRFAEHSILGAEPPKAPGEVRCGELHALALGDIDNDGLPDLVTGKRWWSHGAKGDPEPGTGARIYWLGFARTKERGVLWTPHLIDGDSGVGTQVVADDFTEDGRVDVLSANKKGAFAFVQRDPRDAAGERALEEARERAAERNKSAPGGLPPRGSAGLPPRGSGAADAQAPAPAPAPLAPAARGQAAAALPSFDFEEGELRGWSATGEAFAGQPVEGDAVAARGREPSLHAGRFWIGGYEKHGDAPQGTLSSDPFEVEQPWASFLVGGGADPDTERVELCVEGSATPFFATSGANYESLQRVAVDLRAFQGQRIFIRLVDAASGGWGHINFDDFRFHSEAPAIERPAGVPPILPKDVVEHAGLSPADARAAMEVPPGFQVDLIAAEPDLHQPVALAVDERGRLWVAEAFTYPQRAPEGQGRDDILVFEDKDKDGRFETRTVFAQGLNLVSGLEVGFGGAWVGAAPYLLFLPDRDGDLVADGAPEIVLDGWGYQDTHETLNSFVWGPDGWLYGCHGVFTHSRVGAPGTPDAQRRPIDAGVWRYHPTRKQFEVFAWGTSNPWGLDFDAQGEFFVEACVIPHLFHMVQGGRYIRQAGAHLDAHAYAEIDTIADHRHYLGDNPHGGNLRSNAAGGGHAHCGLLLYQGESFPGEYRGKLLMGNIHGNRINVDRLAPAGSSFVGQHDPDFLLAHDAWFRAIALKEGPAGEVYLIDWYDKQACHWTKPEVWDRTNGRLYRVSYGAAKKMPIDLASLDEGGLVEQALRGSEWYARRARKLLQQRGLSRGAREALAQALLAEADPAARMRALHALQSCAALGAEQLAALATGARTPDALRARAVLVAENEGLGAGTRVEELARSTRSPLVALACAQAFLRRAPDQRLAGAQALLARTDLEQDATLRALVWYAIEPVIAAHPEPLLRPAQSPTLERWIYRRAAFEPAGRQALALEIARAQSQLDAGGAAAAHAREQLLWMLESLSEAVADQLQLAMPAAWPAAYAALARSSDAAVREHALWLSASFGDAQAADALLALARDPQHEPAARTRALEAAARMQAAGLVGALAALLEDAQLRAAAAHELAALDAPALAARVIEKLPAWDADERALALGSLCSRPAYARALVEAVEAGRLEKAQLSAIGLSQLRQLRDPAIDAALERLFGKPALASAQIDMLKAWLASGPAGANTDLHEGRRLFDATCARCHTLFDQGGKLAPELTGANRRDLDYLLQNLVTPSAVVPDEYRTTVLALADGRTLSGIVKKETADALTLQSNADTELIAKSEIEARRLSELSAMPDGQLDALTPTQIASLIGYLQSPAQVAPEPPPLSAGLFDGRTLAGWVGDPKLWHCEDGAIVGHTDTGIAHNAFLRTIRLLPRDFRVELEVRLVPDSANSGVQFFTEPLPDGEVKGYQADIGQQWWGMLYEEQGRGILGGGECRSVVKANEWNRYAIEVRGDRIRTWINGVACLDMTDSVGAKQGILAIQLHAGAPTDVRYRNFALSDLTQGAH